MHLFKTPNAKALDIALNGRATSKPLGAKLFEVAIDVSGFFISNKKTVPNFHRAERVL